MPHILAFDLGGSSLRLALVAPDGAFLATVRKPLEIFSANGVFYDVNPMGWWHALEEGCAELADMGHDLASVSAIAGCGFTRTQVFLDDSGGVMRPAIPFQDSRSADLLDDLKISAPEQLRDVIEKLGPYDPLARFLWLKENEPANWVGTSKVIEPKDFINLMLTGIVASDSISQTPMTRILAGRQDEILSALGIEASILPNTYSPFEVVGEVRTGLSEPLSKLSGVPVHCGSIDTWSGVLGSGALTPGVAYGISGTSDVSGVISDRAYSAPGLLTVQWGTDLWQLGGPSQGAASRLKWALDRFFPDAAPDQTLELALSRADAAPLFLPYLDGERTPWWDPNLRGAFLGLSTVHDGHDFVRAVVEGMNYLSREVLTRAEKAIGNNVSHLCFSGGLASNPALCQLKADVLDRTVLVPRNPETGLVGAARIPMSENPAISRKWQIKGVLYEPNPECREYHADRFSIFRDASALTTDISHRMSKPTGR